MTSLHADDAFLGHYQLSHDPFAARVPGFKFFPAQRKPVLGQLHHLARYSQLLLVVTGPKGSGKTLLRQALVASTNKQSVHSVVVSARGAVEAGGVLRLISQGLNVPQADVGDVLQRVAQLVATGQEVYLLVDDADQLDDVSLDAMMALAAGNADGRAHVFLFADSNLVPRLELYADGAECFHVIELQPYSEEETREYLAQRLEGAGQGIELLSDRQIADIHLASAGWPGAINHIAREGLIDAMLVQRGAAQRAGSGAGFKLPIKHLLALVVVAAGVGGAWMMQGRSESSQPAPTVTQLPLDQAVVPASPAGPAVADDGQAQAGPKIDFAGSSQPLPLPLAGEAQPVIRQPLAQAAGDAEAEEPGAAESSAALPAAVASAPAATVAAVESVRVAPTVATVPPIAKAELPVVTKPVIAAASKPPVAPVVTPGAAVKSTEKPPVAAAKVATAAKVAAVPKSAAASAGWYGSQAPGHYVVQVLGTGVEANAQAFVRQQGADYHYFKKLLQGKPIYVVTYGSFASRAAAQSAINNLPAKVKASKPWPRTVASVQQEIK
ncbi:MAG: SPOR domain-containing protein [Pseudomonas sp.]|uniref:SPOR domain-containing protein n=1 Tax=Pseudomonas sp. TaxID=306 RepID=UPI002735BC19|nr:SPOR domain-containing protein [Pseudomonas sp.]MDP3845716.1 SPOR domain-containing protein [Pseudomonas sp.]